MKMFVPGIILGLTIGMGLANLIYLTGSSWREISKKWQKSSETWQKAYYLSVDNFNLLKELYEKKTGESLFQPKNKELINE